MSSAQTILLVEDDGDDQELFILALSEIKDAPPMDIVNNGKAALERLYRSLVLPSLIFMDINMPLMNGIECLSSIKENPLISHIPVVMLTSSMLEKKQALQLGATGYICKTSCLEELKQSLEQFIHAFVYTPKKWEYK